MLGWPGITGDPPPAVFYWLFYVALVAAAAHLSVAALQRQRRYRQQVRADVDARLGVASLYHRAAQLRPRLTQTTPRPNPRLLGSWLGRDTVTGVACYASVADSKVVLDHGQNAAKALLVPEILDHCGPLFVLSSDPSIIAETWKHRARNGPVSIFDPLADSPVPLPVTRWDPVDGCANPAIALQRAHALMAPPPAAAESVALLRNLLHAAALTATPITQVAAWAHTHGDPKVGAVIEAHNVTPRSWVALQHELDSLSDGERASRYGPVLKALAAFEHPSVLDSCLPAPGQHFDPSMLRSGEECTVYVLAPRDPAVSVTGLTSALLDFILATALRSTTRDGDLDIVEPPVRIVVDDAAHTAALPQLQAALRHGRRGIPVTVVTGDHSAATVLWGQADVRVLMHLTPTSNVGNQPAGAGPPPGSRVQARVSTRQSSGPVTTRIEPDDTRHDDTADASTRARGFIAALRRHRRLL